MPKKTRLFMHFKPKIINPLNLYFQVQIKVLNILMIRNIQKKSMISIIMKIMLKVIQLNKNTMIMIMVTITIMVPTLMNLNNKNTSTNAYND